MKRAIEYTMTHRIGAGGMAERYERPSVVQEMAVRLRKWTGQTETCQSCSSLPAVAIHAGMPLCGRCREQRNLQMRIDPEGRKAPVLRASEDDGAGKQLRGHMIVFNSKSVDLGGFIEIIRPRAADRLEAEKPDLRGLWNHNAAIVLGRHSAGTMRYRKVTRGVAVELDPPRWAHGHVESIERRDVTGMSFGFWALEDEWTLKRDKDGEIESIVREIFDMQVVEGSPVSWPAYPDTDVRVVEGSQRSAWQIEEDTAMRLRMAR